MWQVPGCRQLASSSFGWRSPSWWRGRESRRRRQSWPGWQRAPVRRGCPRGSTPPCGRTRRARRPNRPGGSPYWGPFRHLWQHQRLRLTSGRAVCLEGAEACRGSDRQTKVACDPCFWLAADKSQESVCSRNRTRNGVGENKVSKREMNAFSSR